MLIYKITNTVNDKLYVGQTTRTLEERKQQHIRLANSGHKTHLYNAMRKYGINKFVFEKICDVGSVEDLNILERYYIAKYNCVSSGYNMVDGGNNNVMFIDSVKEKHQLKMSSRETREKISKSMKQYRKKNPFTEEHRAKLSAKAKGNHNFGTGDTRSLGVYCIVDNNEYHFHSIKEAGKWWYENYNPFPYSVCTYQRKIQQNIKLGFSTYGKTPIMIDNIKWYYEIGGDNK